MTPNPYQPPQTPPERRVNEIEHWIRSWILAGGVVFGATTIGLFCCQVWPAVNDFVWIASIFCIWGWGIFPFCMIAAHLLKHN